MKNKLLAACAALAFAPSDALAHCHVQYQVTGPAGLYYQVTIGPYQYLGLLPGGTTTQLGPPVSIADTRIHSLGGTIDVSLTGTDLTGSASCPAVPLNVGTPQCDDDVSPEVPPPCTPSFTLTQTGPHAFSCGSTCASWPQPGGFPASFAPPGAGAASLSSLSPQTAPAGGPGLALAVSGAGFVGTSLVEWNGTPLTTVLVDGANLLGLVPPTSVASPGADSIGVLNPGGPSNALGFAATGPGGAVPGPAGPADPPARVFPNPWKAATGAAGVTFDALAPGSTVKIFTLSGRLVRTLDAPAGAARWDLTNASGGAAASGYYLWLVSGGGGPAQKGRLALIR